MDADKLIRQAIEDARTSRALPRMPFDLEPGEPALADDKVGGVPYLPHDASWPLGFDGQPLELLAQVNCAHLADLPDFPHEGLLQFFVAVTNDGLGMSEHAADLCDPVDFRVLFWERVDGTVTQEEVQAKKPPITADPEDVFSPLDGVFRMAFRPTDRQPMYLNDHRFDGAFVDLWNERHPDMPVAAFPEAAAWASDEDAFFDMTAEDVDLTIHQFGGYPKFAQEDIRDADETLRDLDTVLFQLDSDIGRDYDRVLWGDCGTAVFLIDSQALRSRDFSRVAFSWDSC